VSVEHDEKGLICPLYLSVLWYSVSSVSIDYEHIQPELGSLPEEGDAHLAEFFAGFEIISHPSSGWSSVNIK